jgi:putative phosphoribosyl transferase
VSAPQREASVLIPAGDAVLAGVLELPLQPAGVVVFSHGSGSGRNSPRNRFVAAQLRRAGLATLLLDLLTPAADQDPATRFDIDPLAERLGYAVSFG